MLNCAVKKHGLMEMAIHLAAESGSLEVVKYLISAAGVDKNARQWVS